MSVTYYSPRRAEDGRSHQRMSSSFGNTERMIWWHIYDRRMPISIEFEIIKRPESIFPMCIYKVMSFARGREKRSFLSEALLEIWGPGIAIVIFRAAYHQSTCLKGLLISGRGTGMVVASEHKSLPSSYGIVRQDLKSLVDDCS